MNPEKLEKLIEGGRDGYESRLAAAQARLAAGDAQKALIHLEKAREFNADRSMLWQLMGKACLETGDQVGAHEAWQQGIEIARQLGDKQAEKVMAVWLRRLKK